MRYALRVSLSSISNQWRHLHIDSRLVRCYDVRVDELSR